MKALVLYSSQTGRVKKLAEAIRSVLPANTDFLPMEQAPENFEQRAMQNNQYCSRVNSESQMPGDLLCCAY